MAGRARRTALAKHIVPTMLVAFLEVHDVITSI